MTGLVESNGQLFGTTELGGYRPCMCGVVYELDRKGSAFTETVLRRFGGAGLVLSHFSLYDAGGPGENGQGALNRLYYQNGGFHEKSIYSFRGMRYSDGSGQVGTLIPDANGTLYGLTYNGGEPQFQSRGTAFAISGAGTGAWSETVLHSFKGPPDGALPVGPLVADARGDLYGETFIGGLSDAIPYDSAGPGTVFELMPSPTGYTERVIYAFTGQADDGYPTGGLILDPAGDVYGVTPGGSTKSSPPNGSVFELVPNAGGGFIYRSIYAFKGITSGDGSHPIGPLVADAAGNLYGVTTQGGMGGGMGLGTVFKLAPSGSSYVEHVLHRFSGPDGNTPSAPLLFSKSGVLFGTTAAGGPGCATNSAGCGVVFEVTP